MNLKPKTIAQAFFDSLKDLPLTQVNEALQILRAFHQAYTTEPMLRDFLNHPHIPVQDKIQKIQAILKTIANREAESFLIFLIRLQKTESMGILLPLLHDLRDEQFGVLSVHAATASHLSAEQQEELKTLLKQVFDKKTVELTTQTNADLLGGLVIRVGGQMFDSSLRTQLQKIQLALHA
ncbi:MAG: ATP synthase F1 subunit delta [Candidatus Peregrinibacteria bacterium]